ncbi:hypothetical protein C5167_036053 [Papaver somniferum]|nr:hypothetical protein C5167_036053 [Papaver somniferum]
MTTKIVPAGIPNNDANDVVQVNKVVGNCNLMDLNNIGKAEDRISELPDSLLHHILSFLDIKVVARTSVLSKRWSHIWTSIPTLIFPDLYLKSEINSFMDFVDRTLRLHDASSNIQKACIYMNEHFNASKLELTASFIPLSIPKSFSLPKLESLTLCGFHFIDDCWNEQHISNCPVLENLILDWNWFGVRDFCISTPALKYLEIDHGGIVHDDGLQNCALKINAPNLASLTYRGCVVKEYVLSSFQSLESAKVWLCDQYVPREQKTGAAAISSADDFVNILPTFHNLEKLFLELEETTDKSAFPLLKAAPNLTHLIFNDDVCFNTSGMFVLCVFNGNARDMRWLKLILKNPEDLQTVTYRSCVNSVFAECKEVPMSELPSLHKVSDNEFLCMVITLGTCSWRNITTKTSEISPPPGTSSPFPSRMATRVSRSFRKPATFCGGDLLWRTTSEVGLSPGLQVLCLMGSICDARIFLEDITEFQMSGFLFVFLFLVFIVSTSGKIGGLSAVDSNSDIGGHSAAFYAIAEELGLAYLRAYLDSLALSSFKNGANFATGGSPIRKDKGYSPFHLDAQIAQFRQFKARTIDIVNSTQQEKGKADLPKPEDFSKALYTFDIEQNDLQFGLSTSEGAHAPIPVILDQLFAIAVQVFWVHNTGPIGCLPSNNKYYYGKEPLDKNGCVISFNEIAQEFNRQLKSKLSQLKANLTGAAFTYVGAYTAKYNLINSAKDQGFSLKYIFKLISMIL